MPGRSAAWLARLPWEQEGAVATNKERLLARRRGSEAAGPAVQAKAGCSPVFELVIKLSFWTLKIVS